MKMLWQRKPKIYPISYHGADLYRNCNIIGLFGFKPPTKDLNVTIALAVMSMCLIEYSGIHKNGLKHWVKHFAKPVPFVAPIMVLEIVIRPLSLCMRLFGNVLEHL